MLITTKGTIKKTLGNTSNAPLQLFTSITVRSTWFIRPIADKGDREDKKERNEMNKYTEFGCLRNYGSFTTRILDNESSTSFVWHQ